MSWYVASFNFGTLLKQHLHDALVPAYHSELQRRQDGYTFGSLSPNLNRFQESCVTAS